MVIHSSSPLIYFTRLTPLNPRNSNAIITIFRTYPLSSEIKSAVIGVILPTNTWIITLIGNVRYNQFNLGISIPNFKNVLERNAESSHIPKKDAAKSKIAYSKIRNSLKNSIGTNIFYKLNFP